MPKRRNPAEAEVVPTLRTIWERHRPTVLERLALLDRAAAALTEDRLDPVLRAEAGGAAHRLAGSLGTFGLHDASDRARQAELLLTADRPAEAADGDVLAALTRDIASAVRATGTPSAAVAPADREPSPAAADSPSVLIVEDDRPLADGILLEARRRGLRATVVHTPAAARTAITSGRPDAVLLDLTFDGETADALALLSELTAATPAIPVLVSTVRDELDDRVAVARRGARSFVTKSLPTDQLVTQLIRLIESSRAAEIRVLTVDDDPGVIDAVRALLAAEGYCVTGVSEPQRFWQELERVQPDVVLLDIEMPRVNGIELCRVLRSDPRWATVPVLILTAHRDAETIEAIFAAGADDHIAKPLLDAELRVRVRNRVERLRLHRILTEMDGLTGVANRSAATDGLQRLIRLATRHGQSFALALLDVDRFKDVNDCHGHAAGDDVLRHLGRLLHASFRGEDVVGRWGGEEFAVGMYGIDAEHAVTRVEELLAAFAEQRFTDSRGEPFQVGFSAGVALQPRHGADLDALAAAADAALYRAKAEGRGCVRVAEAVRA